MPDKRTPHIRKAAKAIYETDRYGGHGHQPSAWDIEATEQYATAVLSTTLEPSEAEIAKATLAFNVFFHGINNIIEEEDPAWRAMMEAMRDALIAAAKVRIGDGDWQALSGLSTGA